MDDVYIGRATCYADYIKNKIKKGELNSKDFVFNKAKTKCKPRQVEIHNQ